MNFRTEIGPVKGSFQIKADDRIVLIGSCFADEVGERLSHDGFNVVHNPLGPLYNPESIARVIQRGQQSYSKDDFIEYNGQWHCLDFANRYQDESLDALSKAVNNDYLPFSKAIIQADVLIITLGTAFVYKKDGATVGNCHKLPNHLFEHIGLSVDECSAALLKSIRGLDKNIILTLSPVKYVGDGLSQASLSKAKLRVAIDNVCRETGCDYFPSFEIVNDDLRDYRFYTPDMRHPSSQAVDYIYEIFKQAYFDDYTIKTAFSRHKEYLRSMHRQIITQK